MTRYEDTTLYAVGNETGFGKRDLALEHEFYRWVPYLKIEVISPDSKKGAQLLKDAESKSIPAYVFEKAHKNNVAVQKLTQAGRATIKKSGYALFDLKSGGTEVKVGTNETPNTLDLWVMSQCPFGVRAENKMLTAQAKQLLAQGTKINLRYIIGEGKNPTTKKTEWKSLHGDQELQEDIRQIAIQKTWPDKLWKYIEARNADVHSEDWQSAAKTAGLDPAQVEAKMELGRKLAAQDIKDAAALQVGGSPTYLWQNKYVLNTPEEYKTALGFDPSTLEETKAAQPAAAPGAKAPASKPAAPPADGKCG